ncbi:MAG: hypothetical protein ACLT1W_03330 [Alistipes onderdonkii]
MAYSVTNFALSYQGKLKNSLAGRDDGLVLQGVNAVDNGDGTVSYQKNTAVTENIYTYYQSYKWVRDNGRENTFSTDFLKFKELRIDYQLPKHLMAKTRFLQGASIGSSPPTSSASPTGRSSTPRRQVWSTVRTFTPVSKPSPSR